MDVYGEKLCGRQSICRLAGSDIYLWGGAVRCGDPSNGRALFPGSFLVRRRAGTVMSDSMVRAKYMSMEHRDSQKLEI